MSKPTARELVEAAQTTQGRELASRVEAVLALHKRIKSNVWIHGVQQFVCGYCGTEGLREDWPCPTVRLLNGEKA